MVIVWILKVVAFYLYTCLMNWMAAELCTVEEVSISIAEFQTRKSKFLVSDPLQMVLFFMTHL